MKRIVSFVACFVFFLITIAAAQQAGPSDISIVAPNCSLIPNERIKTGDTLFGLYNTNLGYVLFPSKVAVESGVDERGRKFMIVRVQEDTQALFLITGLPSLKTGKIKTLYSGDKFLFPGQAFNLTSDEQEAVIPTPEEERYFVRAFGRAVHRFNKSLVYDYAVKLFRGNQSQILDYYRATDDSQKPRPNEHGVLDVTDHLVTGDLRDSMGLPVLIWAGDLNRDDKPDLFMWWPCPGKDAGVFSLFLSSIAEKGELVAKIAVGVRLQPTRANASATQWFQPSVDGNMTAVRQTKLPMQRKPTHGTETED